MAQLAWLAGNKTWNGKVLARLEISRISREENLIDFLKTSILSSFIAVYNFFFFFLNSLLLYNYYIKDNFKK